MFNIGPSGDLMARIRQKSGGNTGITGGMGAPRMKPGGGYGPASRPQVMPRPQRPTGNMPFGMGPMPRPEPVSTTMPVGRQRPNIIPFPLENGVGTPGQQPIEENQLWRTYNRLLGGPMAPRMLMR